MQADRGTKRKRWVRWLAGLFGMLAALASQGFGCQRPMPSLPPEEAKRSPWFVDISEASGLDFVHDAGPVGRYFMPQAIGSGAALFDFDNDGRLDIYLV